MKLTKWFIFIVLFPVSYLTYGIEPIIYNQDLRFKYDLEGTTGMDDVETQTFNYRFSLALPAISYRLGSLIFNGSVDYDSLKIGDRKADDFGLKGYGLTLNLFPLRKFHLGLIYSHYESPELFNESSSKSKRYGINYSLSLPGKPKVFLRLDRRENSYQNETDYWDQYELKGNQLTKDYRYNFQFNRDSYTLRGSPYNWWSNTFSFDYERKVFKDWNLYTFSNCVYLENSQALNLNSNLYKTLNNKSFMTSISVGYGQSDNGPTVSNFSLGETATISLKNITFYSSLSLTYNSESGGNGQGENGNNTGYSAMGGVMKNLGRIFIVYGDVSLNHQAITGEGDTKSYHIGFSEGGVLPQFLQRTIFNLTEFSLQRRLKNEYPPNYIPPEISLEILTSRQQSIGGQTFAIDYYHTDGDGLSKMDYLRGDGNLHLNRHFDLYLRGEYTDETNFEGLKRKTNYVYVQNRFKIGRSSINLSYANTDGKFTNIQNYENETKSTSYSISFYSRIWKIPFGIMFRHYKTDNDKYKSFYIFQNFSFRNIVLRTTFEKSYLPNDIDTYRFTFELGRSFDSLLFFGDKLRR